MNGISFQLDETKTHVDVIIQPLVVKAAIDAKALLQDFNNSSYGHFFPYEENIINIIDSLKLAQKNANDVEIIARLAEKRAAEIKYRIEDNDMNAFLTVKAPFGDANPTFKTLLAEARIQGILRGCSSKNIKQLATQLQNAKPGEIFEILVAKGLPVRNGRDSKLKPLVPNALERILKPQYADSTRVDMRNLGDVICVKAGTEVLRKLPPTRGRNGFTVKDITLKAKPGNWKELRPGDGIEQSLADENLYLATITGMPKFKNGKMWIDDIFICKGVNIGTGNVNYDGAVVVNGDVTENMVINASGDVTINGFVESAKISAGGDIIITEGAMGKVDESTTKFSTLLAAEGNIHVQHGQGLNIRCKGSVTIGKQIAYSKIVCAGSVTVGPIDNPDGNIFACEVQCNSSVIAGTLGAVSGSQLLVDFSSSFNALLERKETIDELLSQIKNNNSRHKDKFDLMRGKSIHPELRKKFDEAEKLLSNELQLLQLLEEKSENMRLEKDIFQREIKLVANNKLYSGVTVKLNNRSWRAEREYGKAKVIYKGHQWSCEPLI